MCVCACVCVCVAGQLALDSGEHADAAGYFEQARVLALVCVCVCVCVCVRARARASVCERAGPPGATAPEVSCHPERRYESSNSNSRTVH